MAAISFPPTISSVNGTLQTSFSLQAATVAIPNSNIQMTTRLFEGIIPGPTLRLNPGDTLNVSFTNDLETQDLPYIHNVYSAADESNLHFHGLHVSGELPSDDVTYVVEPGMGYNYSTTLPESHMPGTHWMHPHRHGSTTLQVGGGAVSALIVDDPEGFVPAQVADATEIIFVAQYMNVPQLQQVAAQSRDLLFSISGAPSNEFVMVNGQLNPTISIDPGQWMRFRIVFSNWWEGNLNFQAQGCEMQLLAKDGIYIRNFPRGIGNAPIVPGGRADIMVRCMEPSKNYNVAGMGGTIATITTTSGPVVASTALESWTPDYPAYLNDLRGQAVDAGCSCTTSMDDNAVNGIAFDYTNILHTTFLGSIVERILDGDDHPYHQHVYPYQLITGFGDNYNQHGDWHDVIMGQGTVRFAPTEFTGKLMVHCHRLVHEDQGMMAIEQVNEDGVCTCTADPGLSVGAIVGIAIGSVLFVGLIVFFVLRRRRRRRQSEEAEPNNETE